MWEGSGWEGLGGRHQGGRGRVVNVAGVSLLPGNETFLAGT